MGLELDWTVIGMLFSSIVLIYFFGQLLMRPLKPVLKIAGFILLIAAAVGAFTLFFSG